MVSHLFLLTMKIRLFTIFCSRIKLRPQVLQLLKQTTQGFKMDLKQQFVCPILNTHCGMEKLLGRKYLEKIVNRHKHKCLLRMNTSSNTNYSKQLSDQRVYAQSVHMFIKRLYSEVWRKLQNEQNQPSSLRTYFELIQPPPIYSYGKFGKNYKYDAIRNPLQNP